MSLFLSFLLVAVPGLPLLAGVVARFSSAATAGSVMSRAASAAAAVALLNVGLLLTFGNFTARWAPGGTDSALAVALRLDAVSAVTASLIAFLGAIVLRFSRRYLAGDPGQSRFLSWMSFTLGAVLLLVLSGHLLLLLGAWVATSLCLHRLLLHYPTRVGAVFSARKKIVVSRAGDLCLLAAIAVLYQHYATFDFAAIFAAIEGGAVAGLGWAGALFAGCALLKSAQFPFHSWLPDTMETPTPVSAFMHAGIINAGGFLVVRLAPIFAAAPIASHLLAVMGAITAAFGAVVMLAQPSVKRALAYSTIAQMGFMILQCGLGAYALALLHLCAHSLYKAHAFLTAGSTVGAVPRAVVPLRAGPLTIGVLAGGVLVAAMATALHVFAPAGPATSGVFGFVLALAAAYVIARACAATGGARVIAQGVAVAIGIAALGLALHSSATALFRDLPVTQPPRALVFTIGAVFAALFGLQSLLWRTARYAWGRRLYVHVLNGFYLGTFFNRWLSRLWPHPSFHSHSSCPLPTLSAPLRRPI